MDKLGYIYVLTSPSGKHYIGQTWDAKSRQWQYKTLHTRCKNQPKLYNALKCYGSEEFIFYIIDAAKTQKELDKKECYWIGSYDSINNGYNIREGGSRGKHSSESIDKMKNRAVSEETRKKISSSNKGKIRSDETKDKLRKIGLENYIKTHPNWIPHIKPKKIKHNNGMHVKHRPHRRKSKYQYEILDLNDNTIIKPYNLNIFCIENKLSLSTMFYAMKHGVLAHKRYKIKRI